MTVTDLTFLHAKENIKVLQQNLIQEVTLFSYVPFYLPIVLLLIIYQVCEIKSKRAEYSEVYNPMKIASVPALASA